MIEPRPGALRYRDPIRDQWVEANPHDPLYSTVSMIAEEFWDDNEWKKVSHASEL